MPDKPYVHQEFPKRLYHKTDAPVTVKSREEQDALGEGWVEHPDKLPAEETPAVESAPPAETEMHHGRKSAKHY